MDIGIDFDGTCVTHEFPKVGEDIGAVPVLKELVANGHNLILFTMRSNVQNNTGYSNEVPEVHNGNFLDDAVNWFKQHDIPLYGIQVNPTQHTWTTSPKCYAQLYIDDAALGIPLLVHTINELDETGNKRWSRPYVNWPEVCKMLIQKGLIYE